MGMILARKDANPLVETNHGILLTTDGTENTEKYNLVHG
jgi:hypothetical protein